MTTLPVMNRRTLLAGGASALALALLGRAESPFGTPEPLAALDYTSPEAFAVAEQAYLDLGAEHNEAGLYAWGESYYLLGLLLMFESTGQERYLDTFEDRAWHVLGSTDEARGVSDYSGRSGPVWRAGGNYTAGHGEVSLTDGSPGIQVRWAGSASANATVTVHPGSGDTFDVTLSHPSSTVQLTGLTLDPDASNYVIDAIQDAYSPGARWTAVDHSADRGADRSLAEGTVAFEPQFYAFPVHTGMVVYPLARYVRMVRTDPGISGRRNGVAGRLLSFVMKALRHHEADFHIDERGYGDFRWPREAPVPFDGTIQPLNQSHALGATFAELSRVVGNPEYRRNVEAMLLSLRGSLQVHDDAYLWPYWPVHSQIYNGYSREEEISSYTPFYGAVRSWEDISHGAITLEFIQVAHDAGIADLSEDRRRFATTFVQRVINEPDSVWYRVNGEVEALPAQAVQSARWLMLADIEPAIHDQVLRVYEAEPLEPSQGSHALGIAYLNHSR